MSRAFVKEPDGLEAFEDLPEKLISEHRNMVTAEGLAQIEAEVESASAEHARAQAINDRAAIARAARGPYRSRGSSSWCSERSARRRCRT